MGRTRSRSWNKSGRISIILNWNWPQPNVKSKPAIDFRSNTHKYIYIYIKMLYRLNRSLSILKRLRAYTVISFMIMGFNGSAIISLFINRENIQLYILSNFQKEKQNRNQNNSHSFSSWYYFFFLVFIIHLSRS